jgi:hypothetical protein
MSKAATNIHFLPVSEATAWKAYLEATRALEGAGYVEVEQLAWEQLQAALAELAVDPVGAA